MNYMGTLYDNVLELDYKLYRMNAKELSERLKASYQLSQEDLQTFNSESKIGDSIYHLKQRKEKGYTIKDDDWYLRDLNEAKEKVKNNSHVNPITKQGIQLGYELMPIAISCKGNIEGLQTPIELLDGFNRMFCMDNVPDITILVKVYGELDDRQWINSMILYNSWKFADDKEGAKRYMDRGFQLGLYHRYQMQFIDMVIPDRHMFHYLDIYTSGKDLSNFSIGGGSNDGIYKTFWNNEMFYDDIKAIYEILITRPIFEVKKKGKVESYNSRNETYHYGGLNRILEVFISLLGRIRRTEHTKQIMERKPFNRTILTDYFSDPQLQKHFVKILTMSVDGHIVNYIKAHMREEIKKRMIEGMGYEYKAPEPKKIVPTEPFDISKIKF